MQMDFIFAYIGGKLCIAVITCCFLMVAAARNVLQNSCIFDFVAHGKRLLFFRLR